jgi:hypothetical protein
VAEYSKELHADVGATLKKRDEFSPIEDQQFAIGDRDRISGPLMTVEQSNFTKNFTGLEDR